MNFNQIQFETSFGRPDQFFESDRPEIAFVGRSNVGKSSMINRVFSRKNLARVSSSPGKTATINFFKLENLRFADLPGYGFAKVSKQERERWGELMEAYFSSGRQIELVLSLIDIRHLPSQDDIVMLNFLNESGFPFAVVLTKADKLSKKQREEMHQKIKDAIGDRFDAKMIEFSSETGEGAEKIRELFELVSKKFS
ncbi:MAG: YihA family ribosome biogenesis GTP-binding protein [Oscillospiraceae bacterium]|nr:YihA family ribosome biogenesis GTP-binding protein [Oscillospiraceae bacterium]